MADDSTDILKLILDEVRRNISIQGKLFQGLDENLEDTNKEVISVLKGFGFSSQKLAHLYKVLKQQSSYTKSVSELEKWLTKNRGLISSKDIEALEKTAKQLENASKSLGSTVNGVYTLKNDIALARKQVEDLARIINVHPSSLRLTGGNTQGVILPQFPSLRSPSSLSPYNRNTQLSPYSHGDLMGYPQGSSRGANNASHDLIYNAVYNAAWAWFASSRTRRIGGSTGAPNLLGTSAGASYGSRVGFGPNKKASYGSRVVFDSDGNIIYMDNNDIKRPKVSNWMVPIGSTDPQGSDTPTEKANKDKDREKFINRLVRKLSALPFFKKTEKVATELIRLGMLKWASDKPDWIKKATLGAIGLQVPETITGLAGMATQAALIRLMLGRQSGSPATAKPLTRSAIANGALSKGVSKGIGGKLAGGIKGGAVGLVASLLADPLFDIAEAGGVSKKGVGVARGALHGAGWGAAIGSVIPGVGTGAGALAGAILGALYSFFSDKIQPLWDKLLEILSYIPGIGKFFENQRNKNAGKKFILPDGTVINLDTGTSSGGGSSPRINTVNNPLLGLPGTGPSVLPNIPQANNAPVNTANLTRQMALGKVAASSYYEKLRKSKYIGIDAGSFMTDIQALQTGHQGIIENAVANSPLLQKLGLTYTSALATAGGKHSVGGGYITHYTGGKADFVFPGINSLNAQQRKAIEDAFYTASGGLIKAVFEQDKETGKWHIDESLTKKGKTMLDEANKKQQSPRINKDSSKPYFTPMAQKDPTMTGDITKTLVGLGINTSIK